VHNLLNITLLVSAILTCLAVGVVAAYGLCNLMFLAMRPRVPITAPVVPKIADAA
jgi:nitrate reductase NapE component